MNPLKWLRCYFGFYCRCERGETNCYGGEFGPCGLCPCPACRKHVRIEGGKVP